MKEQIAQVLPLIVLITHIGLGSIFLWWIIEHERIYNFINQLLPHTNKIGLIIAVTATSGSLFYSEIMHLPPCNLCWYQRIFMYPLIIMFVAAHLQKKRNDSEILTMSSLGFFLSGYHYLLQRTQLPTSWCTGVGYSVSCSEIFEMSYGYITIPLMAMTAFGLIAIIFLLKHIIQSKKKTIIVKK